MHPFRGKTSKMGAIFQFLKYFYVHFKSLISGEAYILILEQQPKVLQMKIMQSKKDRLKIDSDNL